MMLVYKQNELCVCELTHALNLSQPKISRHLAQLRQCGLLLDKRHGQWVYYRINPDLPKWTLDILAISALALEEQDIYQTDHHRLNTMSDRPAKSACCE
jgi:ArsR family transcriptional regulator